MRKIEVETHINNLISERFFAGMRKIIIQQQKNKFTRTTEYIKSNDIEKKELLRLNYKLWFDSISNFSYPISLFMPCIL